MAGEIDGQLVGAGGFLGRRWGQSDLLFCLFLAFVFGIGSHIAQIGSRFTMSLRMMLKS